MKKYIFFSSCDLHDMGGLPLYFSGKAKYLEGNGWTVYIFHPGDANPNCAIFSMNKYVGGSLEWPKYTWRYSKEYREEYMDLLVQRIGKPHIGDKVIIETYDYWTSPWVELLAKELRAKHIIVLLNEWQDSDTKRYRKDIEFYKFKLNRKELFCGLHNLRVVFNGYMDVNQEDCNIFKLDEDPVQDVGSPLVDTITHSDWNIAYLGRANKGYLPNIIDGVCEFAKNHPEHNIQFITLGDFTCRLSLFDEKSREIENLSLVELGDQFPIPRSLFQKTDIVIAGSGSARCSVHEGVLTLVADAENHQCNGLLGFDTNLSVYGNHETKQISFFDGLERALVQKVYLDKENTFPPKVGIEACCKQNFQAISSSCSTKKYYSVYKLIDNPEDERVSIKKIAVFGIRHVLPRSYNKYLKYRNAKASKER